MLERVAIAAATTMTAGTVSVVPPPSDYRWIGDLMPIVTGIIMCIIVRAIIDMTAKKKQRWNYNALVMLLCSIFTGVLVHELDLSAGGAMMLGMGAGATGVGLISYGKPLLAAFIGKLNDDINGSGK